MADSETPRETPNVDPVVLDALNLRLQTGIKTGRGEEEDNRLHVLNDDPVFWHSVNAFLAACHAQRDDPRLPHTLVLGIAALTIATMDKMRDEALFRAFLDEMPGDERLF